MLATVTSSSCTYLVCRMQGIRLLGKFIHSFFLTRLFSTEVCLWEIPSVDLCQRSKRFSGTVWTWNRSSLKIHCALYGNRIQLWLWNGGIWTYYQNLGQSLEVHHPSMCTQYTRGRIRPGRVFAEHPLYATGDLVTVYWGENWRSQKENNLAKFTY